MAKYNSDNEETPLKQPHQDAFTSKQETPDGIKQLHIKWRFLDTENLFIIPINWLIYQAFPDVNVEIAQNVYTA